MLNSALTYSYALLKALKGSTAATTNFRSVESVPEVGHNSWPVILGTPPPI